MLPQQPRSLIPTCAKNRPATDLYDSRVATAITRLPAAPALPASSDNLTTSKYERYCAWAEAIAQERQTGPVIVGWALFTPGGQIRDELRKEPCQPTARKGTER